MNRTYTIEVQPTAVEAGKCYRLGGPDELIDVVVFVESVLSRTTVEVTVDLRADQAPRESHSVSYRRTVLLAIIQQGRRPGEDVIPPGTPWETDDRWDFREVEWENPIRARPWPLPRGERHPNRAAIPMDGGVRDED